MVSSTQLLVYCDYDNKYNNSHFNAILIQMTFGFDCFIAVTFITQCILVPKFSFFFLLRTLLLMRTTVKMPKVFPLFLAALEIVYHFQYQR